MKSSILTISVLAASCYFTSVRGDWVIPKPELTTLSLNKVSDTTKPVALSARVVTVYLDKTKTEIASITRFSLGGTDSVYYLLFLDGLNGSYGERSDGFNFDSRMKMKLFITFLIDTEKKHDLSERVNLKSSDGKNITIVWKGNELVVYINHGPYMRCLPSVLNALNVL